MKLGSSQGECALIIVHGLCHCALFCSPSKHDRRLVTEPVNDTKLASLCKRVKNSVDNLLRESYSLNKKKAARVMHCKVLSQF